MKPIVNLYSQKNNEIRTFLQFFFGKDINIKNDLEWSKSFENPIQITDIIGVFIDNNDKFNINMWISLDENFSLNVNDNNADQIIRYLFERYPY